MLLPLPVTTPFSFEQTIAFVRRFPPCQGDHVIADDAITSAVAIHGRAVPFTIRGSGSRLTVEVAAREHAAAVVARAAHFIGADDDLRPLYEAAAGDPPFRALVEQLHGLHHVRFLTLGEIAVYCVMMQRTPIALASRLKRRFLARFGLPVDVAGATLHAMPALAQLAQLDGDDITDAIGHARKGPQIATVVRGVAALGEPFLRDAPYAEARDALLAIPGVGSFSAAAILLRGLGRMDELPVMKRFVDRTSAPLRGAARPTGGVACAEARALYGASYDEAAIARRYGRYIGYWSFYLKTGVPRMALRAAS